MAWVVRRRAVYRKTCGYYENERPSSTISAKRHATWLHRQRDLIYNASCSVAGTTADRCAGPR